MCSDRYRSVRVKWHLRFEIPPMTPHHSVMFTIVVVLNQNYWGAKSHPAVVYNLYVPPVDNVLVSQRISREKSDFEKIFGGHSRS